jgi:ankyrin repeat protein
MLEMKDWPSVAREARRMPRWVIGTVKILGFYDKKISSRVNALQIACAKDAPLDVVEALHNANPKAIQESDSTYQRNALHIAVMNSTTHKTVSLLLKLDPKGATVQDIHGRLPIHYAAKSTLTDERMMRCLLKAYPESTTVSDDNGFLPLHVACRMGQPMSIVRFMIRIAPETILAKTNKGSTPIHCTWQYKEGEPARQQEIVDLLTAVSKETKKMVALHGPLNVSYHGSASVAGSSLSGSNASRSISSSSKKKTNNYPRPDNDKSMTQVPALVALSEHTGSFSSSTMDESGVLDSSS